MPTHYDTLKVAPNAPIDDIKKAYKKLSLEYHPDLVKRHLRIANPKVSEEEIQSRIADATRKFQDINEAYMTLSVPQSRRQYDYDQADNEQRNTTPMPANMSDLFTPEFFKTLSKRGEQNEFLKACCDGNLAGVTSFLNDPGIDPNGIRCSSPSFDSTLQVRSIPLQESVIRKHHAIIMILLAHPKIRAETVEQHDSTWGCGEGHEERWHTPDTRTPLKIAAQANNIEIVNLILRHYIMQMVSNNCLINRLTKPPLHRKSTLLNELAKYRSELWAQLQTVGREQGPDWYLKVLTEILDSEGKLPNQQHPLYLVFTTSPSMLSFFTLPEVISQIEIELSALQQPRPSQIDI